LPLPDTHPDLVRGHKAESQFLEAYSPWLERSNSETSESENCADVDFRIRETGAGIELKTDFYERPVNMYLERWTTERRVDATGPWKARDQGAEFLAYWYASLGRIYIFRTDELIRHVESLPESKRREAKMAGPFIMGPVSELAFWADRRRDEAKAIHGRADYWRFE
jgi:hypothetical protein